MKKEWVLAIRDQCYKAGVPFFFKQWGGVRKKQAGRKIDGKTYDEFPSRVESPVIEKRGRLAAILRLLPYILHRQQRENSVSFQDNSKVSRFSVVEA